MKDCGTGTFWSKIREEAISGGGITEKGALAVLQIPEREMWRLFEVVNEVRRFFKGDKVKLCSILNAKSGYCSEDCAFCAQSRRSQADIEKYPLMDEEAMVAAARDAKKVKAGEFSIVASGFAMHKKEELKRVGDAISRIKKEEGMETCASLGALSREDAIFLLSCGLRTIHHNLETSRSFFGSICTTHAYEDDVRSIREAKKAGARVCSGGIFGIGETPEDRVELAATLREIDVDSIPVNFLNPIPGTPLAGVKNLSPFDCLKIIAMLRLFHPARDVIVCGGRRENLRDLQALIFAAGANGLMIGNYLTTSGRSAESDLGMIEDMGLKVGTR
jgi:biotin synthase